MAPIDRRAFLESVMLAGVAATLPTSLYAATRFECQPADSRFRRFRPRLCDEPDPRALFNAIRLNLTRPLTRQHQLDNGAHGLLPEGYPSDAAFGVPTGRGEMFFTWHRQYLGQLESLLGRPLPSWAPWEPMPAPFNEVGDTAGIARVPDRQSMLNAFLPFQNSIVTACFADIDGLGKALSWTAHFAVHTAAGGKMASVPRSSEAPIFWPWHAFVDDIYQNYLKHKRSYDPRPPKDWPWGSAPPRISGGGTPLQPGGRPVTKTVPFCVGLSRDRARSALADAGLAVDERHFQNGADRTVSQRPLPFTQVDAGSRVMISARLER